MKIAHSPLELRLFDLQLTLWVVHTNILRVE